MDSEVQKMLDLEVIQTCTDQADQIVSTLFLRDKKDGGLRPIINFKSANKHLRYEHFKIEGLSAMIETIQLNDYQ